MNERLRSWSQRISTDGNGHVWESHTATKPYIPPLSSDRNNEMRAVLEHVSDERARLLVEQSQQGNQDAFGELYRLHFGSVWRLARFYLPADEADDAAAEAFTRAWKALPRYRHTGAPFVSWLYGIARHVVYDAMRARKRSEPREELPDDPSEPHSHVVDRLDLARAMEHLPEEQRQVLEMKFLIGMRNAEVADLLDKTIGAVNAQQWRAIRSLRRIMGER